MGEDQRDADSGDERALLQLLLQRGEARHLESLQPVVHRRLRHPSGCHGEHRLHQIGHRPILFGSVRRQRRLEDPSLIHHQIGRRRQRRGHLQERAVDSEHQRRTSEDGRKNRPTEEILITGEERRRGINHRRRFKDQVFGRDRKANR